MAWGGDWTASARTYLGVLAAYSLLYIALVRIVLNRDVEWSTLRFALVVLGCARWALALAPPTMSDDVYRSVWEGRIQLHGGNPYAWSDRPEAEKWTALRDTVYERMNHRDYAAIYPPAWEWAMRGVVFVHDSVTSVKVFLTLSESLLWGALVRFLRKTGQKEGHVLIFAASPLALFEIAGSGHNDGFAMTLMTIGLLFVAQQRDRLAAVALTLATATKFFPALFVAPLLRRIRAVHVAIALAVSLLVSAPFWTERAGLSLRKYGDYWRFNETVFAFLAFAGGSQRGGVVLALLALAAIALASARNTRRPEMTPAISERGLALALALIALMPNVLPWYGLWVLLFATLATSSVLFRGALGLTLTLPLAYLVYPDWLQGEPWRVSWLLRAFEYGVPVSLLVMDFGRARTLARTIRKESSLGRSSQRPS